MPTYENIPALESKFEINKRASGGIYFNTVDSNYPGGTGLRPKTGKNGTQYESYYYTKEYTKNKIILHSTVGFLTGDFGMLAKPNMHMSTQYVIGRNGVVYELFSPKYWSYHLGKSAVGGNGYGSKESIAIELSNIGPLELDGTILRNVYGSKYCTIDQTEAYTEYPEGFRGYKYFASFTNDQYLALQQLLLYLTTTYNIPYTFLPESKRVNVFSSGVEARKYRGICSHVNFRPTGKYDIGPDFDWEKITSDANPIEPDPESKFVYEDDIPATNIFDKDFGKVSQTSVEKAKVVNNNNSSHYCSLSNVDSQDETYESGALGGSILDGLNDIDWSSIDSTDMEAMRKACTDKISEGIYNFITSADISGEPLHYSNLTTTTGTHIIPPAPAAIPVIANLDIDPIGWPSLSSLQNVMNKYYTGISDLFKSIFEDWLGTITVKPKQDNPVVFFTVPYSIVGDFKFKWDSTLVAAQAAACEAQLQAEKPSKIIETWTIIQDWFFKTLSLAIAGEQNGTGLFTPGPSLGSVIGGGGSSGYCLGVIANVYTPTASVCTLTFNNPNV